MIELKYLKLNWIQTFWLLKKDLFICGQKYQTIIFQKRLIFNKKILQMFVVVTIFKFF